MGVLLTITSTRTTLDPLPETPIISLMALPLELFEAILALTFPPIGEIVDIKPSILFRDTFRTNRAFYEVGHSIMRRRNAWVHTIWWTDDIPMPKPIDNWLAPSPHTVAKAIANSARINFDVFERSAITAFASLSLMCQLESSSARREIDRLNKKYSAATCIVNGFREYHSWPAPDPWTQSLYNALRRKLQVIDAWPTDGAFVMFAQRCLFEPVVLV